MQLSKIIQAVILLTIIALAASCAATKEYTSKVFPSGKSKKADTTVVVKKTTRFLEIETGETDPAQYLSKNVFSNDDTSMVKDETALANNNKKKEGPAPSPITKNKEASKETIPATEETETAPVVKNTKNGTVRNKRTRE